MLSFAPMMPSMLLFVWTRNCSKIVCAFFESHSGTNLAGPFATFLVLKSGFRMSSLPLLNQNAFASVGPPQSCATTPSGPYVPLAFMPARTPRACRRPTRFPLNET